VAQPTFLDRQTGKSQRVPVSTTRELLVIHLRTYGEDAVAASVVQASEETLERIFDRADHYLYADEFAKPSGVSPFLAEALSRAAVEVIEGAPRTLRWKRRKLKGIYPGC
jgi:hypothetical protein